MNLSIIWDFDPVIFSVGGFDLLYYSLMWALAFGQGMIVLAYILKREGEPEEYNTSLFYYMIIGTIVGARLGHCLFYDPMYFLAHPFEILDIRGGGLASHGGTIGIMVGLYLFSRKYKKTYIWILDRCAMVVPIGSFLIRIGNLMNSEIYGFETSQPWGFVFVRKGETLAKHPTQIYEGLLYLVVFAVLFYMYTKKDVAKKYPGMLIGTMFIMIFLGRFIIENYKEIQVDFEQGMALNMGQWLSIPFVLAGIYLIYNSLKKRK